MAMVEAVAEGLIDIISSMHTPAGRGSKRLPFEEAASGAVGLETFLPAALRLYHAGDLDLPTLFRAMSLNPAQRLGLPRGGSPRARPPTSCCSTRTRPSCSTASPAVEIEEHPLRRPADAGQGPRDMGRRASPSSRGD